MNILITCFSQSGNTRRVAQAILEVLATEATLIPMEQVGSLDSYDLVFIGFPVHQFGVPAPVRKFLLDHAAGKRLALFVTHAVDGESSDPFQRALLVKELKKCTAACSQAILLGLFHCRGALSDEVVKELTASGNQMLQAFAAMQPSTAGHPDPNELDQAREFAREIIRKVSEEGDQFFSQQTAGHSTLPSVSRLLPFRSGHSSNSGCPA